MITWDDVYEEMDRYKNPVLRNDDPELLKAVDKAIEKGMSIRELDLILKDNGATIARDRLGKIFRKRKNIYEEIK
jgi:hypothetical protein